MEGLGPDTVYAPLMRWTFYIAIQINHIFSRPSPFRRRWGGVEEASRGEAWFHGSSSPPPPFFAVKLSRRYLTPPRRFLPKQRVRRTAKPTYTRCCRRYPSSPPTASDPSTCNSSPHLLPLSHPKTTIFNFLGPKPSASSSTLGRARAGHTKSRSRSGRDLHRQASWRFCEV